MKKYLIMLAVFVAWCITLPVATNFAKASLIDSSGENLSELESSQIEETQDSNQNNSEYDTSSQIPVNSDIDLTDESSDDVSRIESEVTESHIDDPVSQPEVSDTTSKEESELPNQSAGAQLHYVNVYNHKTGNIMKLEFEEYIIGVVYAEIPSSFNDEAIKAQAIAARSYALNNIISGQRERGHDGASLCTSPGHCSGYYTKADMAARYGDEFAAESYNIIKKAVNATRGIVMTYEGMPANTVFHASSSGFTESCVEVWGNNLPYLVSVTTPDESNFYAFYGKTTMTTSEFKTKLSSAGVKLTGSPTTWITNIKKNAAGRVDSITIGDKTFTGEEIRSRFGLKSTKFKVSATETNISFDTEGYGHGVGMSQYGAEIMATNGSSAQQILRHYYTGVKLEHVKDEWFN